MQTNAHILCNLTAKVIYKLYNFMGSPILLSPAASLLQTSNLIYPMAMKPPAGGENLNSGPSCSHPHLDLHTFVLIRKRPKKDMES